jgi:hypothetical protein
VQEEIERAEALLNVEQAGKPLFDREQTEAGICALRVVAAAIRREIADNYRPGEESREQMAAQYVRESGKVVHSSDCATSVAPAFEPGPCDCSEPQPTTPGAPEGASGLSDFIRNWSPEAKAEVYAKVMDKVAAQQQAVIDGVAVGAPTEPLPHWEPCNPGCDPEFNGQRSRHCAKLCHNAREALAAAGVAVGAKPWEIPGPDQTNPPLPRDLDPAVPHSEGNSTDGVKEGS